MGEKVYEFVDLDKEEAFVQLCTTFGGVLKDNTIHFNNSLVSGKLCRCVPEKDTWIRKWKLNVSEKIILRKMPAPEKEDKKLCIVYLLNPTIFTVKKSMRSMALSHHRNNVFFTSEASLDFSVVPKQPFYVLDLAITTCWIERQFADADPFFKEALVRFISGQEKNISLETCSMDEFKILRELELSETVGTDHDLLFLRSRFYKLLIDFFCKVLSLEKAKSAQGLIHYEQVMQAEKLVMSDLKQLQKVEWIAKQVNLSISSLMRQFQLVFGKGIQEYYICRKMEAAKSLLLKQKHAIKEIAQMLGYKQPSAFIEMFTKHHGYCPGMIKEWKAEV
ncbi:helix-turn-helix transcriptional regulator [Flavisolibacter sp. BT320]|nr:helix-turn-helix transcriptional regulator [Flavisolibacter longurius]